MNKVKHIQEQRRNQAKTSKKFIYLFLAVVLMASCSTPEPFEGKITYEAKFESGFGNKVGFIDDIIGQGTNSEIDLYVKEGKVLMETEADNAIFGSFRGPFTKVMFDLDHQRAYWINDKDKTYAEESLLTSDIEGFNFKTMKEDLDETKKNLTEPLGNKTIKGYDCKEYELEGTILDGKVALSPQLLLELQTTMSKIEGLQDYDFTGLGFPLAYESKVAGIAGMKYEAILVDKKELSDNLFSIDGYKKVDKLEYYKENIENFDLESLGLKDEADSLMKSMQNFGSDLKDKTTEQLKAWQDSLGSKLDGLNLDNMLDGVNDLLDDK